MTLIIDTPPPRCEDVRSLYGHRFKLVKFTRSHWECEWCGKDRDDNDKEIENARKNAVAYQHVPDAWPSRHFHFLPADEFLSRGRGVFPSQMGDE